MLFQEKKSRGEVIVVRRTQRSQPVCAAERCRVEICDPTAKAPPERPATPPPNIKDQSKRSTDIERHLFL